MLVLEAKIHLKYTTLRLETKIHQQYTTLRRQITRYPFSYSLMSTWIHITKPRRETISVEMRASLALIMRHMEELVVILH